jgi:hypothetical protein
MKKILTAGLSFILTAFVVSSFGAYKPRLDVSQGYVTTNNLGIGGNYDSGVLDMQEYTQVQTHINASHDGNIDIEFCSDAGGADVVRSLSIPYVAANGFQLFSAPAFTPYVRYQFTNSSGIAQTDFFYQTKFLTKGLTPQLLRADGFISDSMVSTLSRSVLVGKDAAGNYRNVPVDSEGHLDVHIDDPITAFGDLRVAELTPQIQLKFPYNINSDIVTTNVENGGVVSQINSMCKLSSSTATNGSAIMQSRRTVNYRSGLGSLARFTSLFTTGVADSTQIIGIGNELDGYFFGYNGTSFGLLVRKNGTDTWTASTSWNVDTLDGTGGTGNPSGMNIDETKINVFQIKYQWLGAGAIEFAVEDPNSGQFTPVHRVQYANANTDPSVYNPSLKLYAQVINSGNNSDIIIQTASMAGFCEGKDIPTGPVNTYERTEAIDENQSNPFFVLQNKSVYNSKTNRTSIIPLSMAVGNSLNGIANVKLYLNMSITNTPTYADVNGDNSVIEAATDQLDNGGGKLIFVGSVGPTSAQVFDFTNVKTELTPGDTLNVIVVTPDAAGNPSTAEATVSFTWQEDF